MSICAGACESEIKKDEDFITCDGFCGNKFHTKCCEFQKSKNTIEAIRKYKTVVFKCDDCVDIDQYIKESNSKILQAINALNEKFDMISCQIDKKINEKFVELSQEIKEVNNTIDANKNDNENENMSWNEVVKKKFKNKVVDPVVIVRSASSSMKRDDIKKTISQSIDASKYSINGTKKGSNNSVVIRCQDTETQEQLINEISNTVENVTAEKPKSYVPKIKILRVSNPEKDDNELISQICKQNNEILMEKLKIVKRESVYYKGKIKDDVQNIIIELKDIETYKKIMNKSKIRHQFEVYKVVDNINMLRCYKCYGFHHIARDCKNNLACFKCAGPHRGNECKSNVKKCINCQTMNEKLNLDLDVNHDAWSKNCKVYIQKLEKSKKALSYMK